MLESRSPPLHATSTCASAKTARDAVERHVLSKSYLAHQLISALQLGEAEPKQASLPIHGHGSTEQKT
ncbi:MAG: hypothetical protein ACK52I_09305 [Pseudomonadota bacterium]